jgi:hypothetical protein
MIHESLLVASLRSHPEAQFDLALLGAAELRVFRTGQRVVPTYDGHVNSACSWIPTGEGFVQQHTQLAPSTTSSLAALELLFSTKRTLSEYPSGLVELYSCRATRDQGAVIRNRCCPSTRISMAFITRVP